MAFGKIRCVRKKKTGAAGCRTGFIRVICVTKTERFDCNSTRL